MKQTSSPREMPFPPSEAEKWRASGELMNRKPETITSATRELRRFSPRAAGERAFTVNEDNRHEKPAFTDTIRWREARSLPNLRMAFL